MRCQYTNGIAPPLNRSVDAAQEVDVPYLPLKALHVFAAVILPANTMTGLFWHAYAARRRDARVISHAMRGIIVSDRLFTTPGVIVILVSGVLLAVHGGYPLLRTSWIL